MKFLKIIAIILFLNSNVLASHLHHERFYQHIWCSENNGREEVKLIDDTRVDCVTKTHAIEFDFATKWAESIGQSLHYSRMTGKKAGIVLIIENSNDFKYYNRIKPLCEMYNISLWYIKPPKENVNSDNNIDIEYLINTIINYIKNLLDIIISIFSAFS